MIELVRADVAVIGAGIAGAGVAADLAGDMRVVMIEMEDRPGYHATGRSAAILIQNYGNAVIRALTRDSVAALAQPDPPIFERSLLSPRGMLTVADADSVAAHRELLRTSEGLAEISVAEAVRLVPILDPQRILEASYEADARDIDVAALHQGWLRIAMAAGTRLLKSSPVLSAERSNGRWRVATPDAIVEAGVVVNAAGAWGDHVAAIFGAAPVGLQPMRRSIAVVPAPDGHDCRHWPIFDDTAERWYAKPEAGRLLVSPADEDPVDPHDAFVDDMVLAQGIHRYESMVTTPVTRVERTWAGLRTFAPDRTPVAGFDPQVDGLFWLCGQGGYGIQTSPALSRLSGALIRREPPPDALLPLVPLLAPARFASGAPADVFPREKKTE
jgi:D-arginine dehydrogenase